MTELLDLPTECLLRILHFLKTHQIQIFAETFNQRILELCLPLLISKLANDRNKRRMKTIFGKSFPMMIDLDTFGKARLDFSEIGLSWPDDPSDHLQYLQLNGEFDWLLPNLKEDDNTVQEFHPLNNDIAVTDMHHFRVLAKQLNIEKAVPDIFWRLGANGGVTCRIPNGSPSESMYCFVMRGICRISAEFLAQLKAKRELTGSDSAWKQWKHKERDDDSCDNNAIAAGNYIFTFYVDQASDSEEVYRNLFLDTDGGHCILNSDPYERLQSGAEDSERLDRRGFEHLKGEVGSIRELTFDEADDLYLEATDLEEWLVTMNYVERVKSIGDKNDNIIDKMNPDRTEIFLNDLKQYILNVYTNEGRKEQLDI